MAKGTQTSGTKGRGRTNITGQNPASPTTPHTPQEVRAEANRPVSSGGKHRGDRRDMSPTYTGNAKHAARGNNPRKDVKTRAR
jgi:hypothetical protein